MICFVDCPEPPLPRSRCSELDEKVVEIAVRMNDDRDRYYIIL